MRWSRLDSNFVQNSANRATPRQAPLVKVSRHGGMPSRIPRSSARFWMARVSFVLAGLDAITTSLAAAGGVDLSKRASASGRAGSWRRAGRRRLRAARPALVRLRRTSLVRDRHRQPPPQPIRSDGLLHLAMELSFDDHADQPRAETRSSAPPGGRPATLVPIEHEREALLRARYGPAQFDAACANRKAAVLACIGR